MRNPSEYIYISERKQTLNSVSILNKQLKLRGGGGGQRPELYN